MKKKSVLCFLICILIAVSNLGYSTALAGIPPYVPIYELINLDSNDALSVTSQTLTINPPSEPHEPSRYSPNMPNSLSTEYQIENKAATANSRVAVTHFGNLWDDLSLYKLSANNQDLSPTVYYKNLTAMFDQTEDYSTILEDAFFEPVFYDDSLFGTSYVFTTAPMVSINFTLNQGQKIIYSANSISFTQGVGINTTGSLASSSGVVTIFVINGTLNYSCNSPFEVETTEISYNDLLAEMDYPIDENLPLTSYLFTSNYFDTFLNGSNDAIDFSNLLGNLPRCMILVYNIEFVSGSNILTLARPIKYTYNYGYEPPLFALHIKSAPLKTWSEFHTTNIVVTTLPDLPYIIDDDLTFQKIADNSYSFSGHITSFDEYYIVYCESASPKNTDTDEKNKLIWWIVGGITVSVGAGVGVYFLIGYIQKRKAKRNI